MAAHGSASADRPRQLVRRSFHRLAELDVTPKELGQEPTEATANVGFAPFPPHRPEAFVQATGSPIFCLRTMLLRVFVTVRYGQSSRRIRSDGIDTAGRSKENGCSERISCIMCCRTL
jgi:hypothetical protein